MRFLSALIESPPPLSIQAGSKYVYKVNDVCPPCTFLALSCHFVGNGSHKISRYPAPIRLSFFHQVSIGSIHPTAFLTQGDLAKDVIKVIPKRVQQFSGKKVNSLATSKRLGIYCYVLSLLWLMSRIAAFCLSLDRWPCFFRPRCQMKSGPFRRLRISSIFGVKGESELCFRSLK